MIRHICMFKLKEEYREAGIPEFFARAESMRNLEMVRGFSVVSNAPDAPEANYDVSLIIDFDDVAGLEEYRVSPPHVAFGKFITPIRESRACIDYEF